MAEWKMDRWLGGAKIWDGGRHIAVVLPEAAPHEQAQILHAKQMYAGLKGLAFLPDSIVDLLAKIDAEGPT